MRGGRLVRGGGVGEGNEGEIAGGSRERGCLRDERREGKRLNQEKWRKKGSTERRVERGRIEMMDRQTEKATKTKQRLG